MSEPGRSVYRLYKSLWAGLDLVYPPYCGGCGRKGMRWCLVCQNQVRIIELPVCRYCGRRLIASDLCVACKSSRPNCASVRSWADFDGPVRNALHKMKYSRDVSLGEILSRPLIRYLQEARWPIDLIVPVPLGLARRKERGYNQAGLIARPIALATGLRYQPKALARVRETRSQVGLPVDERRANVVGAFRARTENVRDKNVLIVDDVLTTGSTIEACAVELIRAGAKQVYGLTVARAA